MISFSSFQTVGQADGVVSELGLVHGGAAAGQPGRPPEVPVLGDPGGLPVRRRRMRLPRTQKVHAKTPDGLQVPERR